MAAPAAALDLINLALLQIYHQPITNLQDTTKPAAVAANLVYDFVRQAELRDGTWNFARDRRTISLINGVTPLFDYLGAYQLPKDLLKLHHVGTEYDLWSPLTHDMVAGNILYFGFANDPAFGNPSDMSPDTTNWPPSSLYIEGTFDITDVTTFDPLFRKLMVYALAKELAMPLTGDPKIQQIAELRYLDASKEARAINHQERPMRVIQRDPIAEARLMDSEIWDGQLRVPAADWPGPG